MKIIKVKVRVLAAWNNYRGCLAEWGSQLTSALKWNKIQAHKKTEAQMNTQEKKEEEKLIIFDHFFTDSLKPEMEEVLKFSLIEFNTLGLLNLMPSIP